MTVISKLPKDLLLLISLKLTKQDLLNWALLNRYFYNITINNDMFWRNKLTLECDYKPCWKEIYMELSTTDIDKLFWDGLKKQDISLVKAAISRGLNIKHTQDIKVPFYVDPLEYAVRRGNLDIFKYLVENCDEPYLHVCKEFLFPELEKFNRIDMKRYLKEHLSNVVKEK